MDRRTDSDRPRTVPRLLALLLCGLFLAGCATTSREVVTSPDVSATAAAGRAAAVEPVNEAPVVEPAVPEPTDEPEISYEIRDVAAAQDVRPERAVSSSPLDDLALIEPAPAPEDLEKSRDLVAQQAPTYDIPIEVNDRVLAWVDLYSGKYKRSFETGLARSGRYLQMFRRIFADEGVPQDLVYMAHVESGYKTSAYSRAHARGVYQFISATARRYGLRVDYWVDERSDPELAAHAAARYMKDLYAEFGDWYLALAAYNAGEGKVRRALSRTGKKDFWSIAKTRHLRRETKNHIPAILAATILSKEPEKYGLEFKPDPPILYDTIQVEGAADLRVLARCANADLATLEELNPAIRRGQTPFDGPTPVRVPYGSGALAAAALDAIPAGERVLYARHRVKQGDTLSGISAKYGVGVKTIQQANGMGSKTLIRVNQIVKVPTAAATRYAATTTSRYDGPVGEVMDYRVRRGDTLFGIAGRYGTTAASIAAANNIPVHGILHIGDRLKVVSGVRSESEARKVARAGLAPSAGGDDRVVHTVRRGDTLWHIASVYRTTVNVLCSLNKISPSTILHPGVQLTVGYR